MKNTATHLSYLLSSAMLISLFSSAHADEDRSVIKLSIKGGMVEGIGGVTIFKNGQNCSEPTYLPLRALKSGKLSPKIGEQITFGIDTPWEVTETISETEQKLSICREIITITANQDRYRIELIAKGNLCEIRVNGLKVNDLSPELASDVSIRKQISAQKDAPACTELPADEAPEEPLASN